MGPYYPINQEKMIFLISALVMETGDVGFLHERVDADGRVFEAETIFRRLTWLGDCLPYWGDSHYADRKDYRHGTLQLNLEGVCIAQTIIFSLFGVSVDDDFSIRIALHLPGGVDHISLYGLRLAGRTLDVRCTRADGVVVDCGGRRFTAPLGGSVTLPSCKPPK